MAIGLPADLQFWVFLAFFLGFAIKVPMFPFHTWLPDAHVRGAHRGLGDPGRRAAEDGDLRLHALLAAAPARRPTAAARVPLRWSRSRIIGIVYAALVTLVQKDMKKLIAYSSVSHLGFVHARHVRAQPARASRAASCR